MDRNLKSTQARHLEDRQKNISTIDLDYEIVPIESSKKFICYLDSPLKNTKTDTNQISNPLFERKNIASAEGVQLCENEIADLKTTLKNIEKQLESKDQEYLQKCKIVNQLIEISHKNKEKITCLERVSQAHQEKILQFENLMQELDKASAKPENSLNIYPKNKIKISLRKVKDCHSLQTSPKSPENPLKK